MQVGSRIFCMVSFCACHVLLSLERELCMIRTRVTTAAATVEGSVVVATAQRTTSKENTAMIDNSSTAETELPFSVVKIPRKPGANKDDDDDFFWLLETEKEIPDMKALADLIRPEIIKRVGSFPQHLENIPEPRLSRFPSTLNAAEPLTRSRRHPRRSAEGPVQRVSPMGTEMRPEPVFNPEILAMAAIGQPSVPVLLLLIQQQQKEQQRKLLQQQSLEHLVLPSPQCLTPQQQLNQYRIALLESQLQQLTQFPPNVQRSRPSIRPPDIGSTLDFSSQFSQASPRPVMPIYSPTSSFRSQPLQSGVSSPHFNVHPPESSPSLTRRSSNVAASFSLPPRGSSSSTQTSSSLSEVFQIGQNPLLRHFVLECLGVERVDVFAS